MLSFRKITKYLLVISTIYLFFLTGFSQVSLPPYFETTEEKLEYLLWVESIIPDLFQEGAEYDIDLFTLIDNQNIVVRDLSKSKKYMSAIKKSQKRVNLTISESTQEISNYYTLESDSIKTLKKSYTEIANEDPVETLAALEEKFSELQKTSSQGLIGGLAKSLSAKTKPVFFKLTTVEEQIEFLTDNKNLSEKTVSSKFNFSVIKDWDQALEQNKENLLAFIEAAYKSEMTFYFEAIAALLKYGEFEIEQSSNEKINEHYNEVLEEKANYIADSKAFKNNKLKKSLGKFLNLFAKKASPSSKKEEDVLRQRVHLLEMPPYLGVFRGLCGGDCATEFSFPYVYATNERTYLVVDENYSNLGYVQGTEVEFESGEFSLYLHDISGPRMSVNTLDLIIKGLYLSREKLGYDYISIPNTDIIHDNVNYKNLRKYLTTLANKHYEKFDADRTVYLDADSREIIGNSNTNPGINTNYDTPEKNENVQSLMDKIMDPLIEESGEISVEIDNNLNHKYKPSKDLKLTKEKGLFFILGLMYGERSPDAKQELSKAYERAGQGGSNDFNKRVQAAISIAESLGINGNFVKNLSHFLTNPDELSIKEFYKEFENRVKEEGFKLSKNYKEIYYAIFTYGHLNAEDAMKNKSTRNLTIKHVIGLLKKWPNPQAVVPWIEEFHEDFSNSLDFNTFLLTLMRDESTSLEKLKWIKNLGITIYVDRKSYAQIEELRDRASLKKNQNLIALILKSISVEGIGPKACLRVTSN